MKSKNEFKQLKELEKNTRMELILSVAESIFSEKPYEEVHIRDLAKELGISPGSIYTYFPDKESLYKEVTLRGFERAMEIFEESKFSIEKAAVKYVEIMIENYNYMKMVHHCVSDGKLEDEDSINRLAITSKKFFDIFDSFLKKSVPEKDLRLTSHLFFSSLNGIIFTFANYPGRSRKEILKHTRALAKLFTEKIVK